MGAVSLRVNDKYNITMDISYSEERNVQILIALLKENGIKRVVASPGSTNVCFVGSIQSDPYFEIYSCVDERSAAYMACGIAEETSEPVLLSCTGATASRNYYPAMTEAFYRRLPVIAITSSQQPERIGHMITQVTDRRQLAADVVVASVEVPVVLSDDEKWNCEIQVNKALLACKQRGGGPVHINLITNRSRSFGVKTLPKVNAIKHYDYEDTLPELPAGKKVVFIGSHRNFSETETRIIDDFCASQDAVVFYEMTSGYYGRYGVKYDLIAAQSASGSDFKNVDLLIHIGEIAGADFQSFIKPKQVWRVCRDGEIKDPFRKLTCIFEMTEEAFFSHYTEENADRHQLYDAYKDETARLFDKLRNTELPFSHFWIAEQLAGKLPANSEIHSGILNSFRSWNMFELPESVRGYCNVGGYGIDGCVSSMVGASFIHPERIYFGVFGDLAFFYDMNSIGNRHIRNNIRIILVNNGKGNEFHNRGQLWEKAFSSDEIDRFGSAAGHFGNKSPELVKHYAQDLGFEYMCSTNKDEFNEVAPLFMQEELTERPLFWEIFTNGDDDALAYQQVRSLDESTVAKIKGKVVDGMRDAVGDNMLRKIHALVK